MMSATDGAFAPGSFFRAVDGEMEIVYRRLNIA